MKQREPRRSVTIPARIRWDGAWSSAMIRNISSRGLMLCAAKAPPRGTYVEIRVGKTEIIARSVWSMGGSCGLTAQSAIDIAALTGEGARVAAGTAVRDDDTRPAASFARAPSPHDQAERSRRQSSMMQFVGLTAATFVTATALGWGIYTTLSNPISAVEAHL